MTLAEIVARKKNLPAVVSILPDQSLQDAIDLLCRYRIGALIVLSPATGRIVGICSERDVLRALCRGRRRDPDTVLVRDIMTTNVVLAEAHHQAFGALRLMSVHQVRHLPVLEGDRLVGVVTIGDVLRELYEAGEARLHSLEEYLSGTYRSEVY